MVSDYRLQGKVYTTIDCKVCFQSDKRPKVENCRHLGFVIMTYSS